MKKFLTTVGVIVLIPTLFVGILLFSAAVVYVFDATGLAQVI